MMALSSSPHTYKNCAQSRGRSVQAVVAHRESQSRIFKTEAPQFVGGEGTDNLDFMADLSALKVIDPDAIPKVIQYQRVHLPS